MSGYGAKTTGITENTTGAREDTLKLATAGAVLRSSDKQNVTVGVNEQEFKCVDTSKLTDLTNQLQESNYTCANPTDPKQSFKATVKHGPNGPK